MKVSLMERLIKAGYPRKEMYNHESDLYVYVTDITTAVIKEWCEENKFNMSWHCPIFKDQISGKMMYDCYFQYINDKFIKQIPDDDIEYNHIYYPCMTKRDVRNIDKLNKKYGYGISNHSLRCLVAMYKKAKENNDKRTMSKIEYRLTDINFHSECAMLKKGEYDII